MDEFKQQHVERKCKAGCCHPQPNKVARVRLKLRFRKEVQDAWVAAAREQLENELAGYTNGDY